MPADVSFPHVSTAIETLDHPARRFPVGLGLTFAAVASVGLWVAVAAGVRALFGA